MLRRSLFALALVAAAVSPAQSATRYRLVDLGFVTGGTSAYPTHFGPDGAVLGTCNIPGTFGGHATRWNVSPTGAVISRTDLQGLDGFDWSTASAMNSSGWIAGYSNTADPQPRAVLWRNGELLDLDRGADGNANIYAFDINEAGVMCGMITKSGGGGGWDAAIWQERAGQPGRFDRTFLPLHPSGDLFSWTEAQDILESGRVFGRTSLGLGGDRATLWEADAVHTPILLEPLDGSVQSMPGDINELGDAVGYTMYSFGQDVATRWSRDSSHTPSALPKWPGYSGAHASVISPSGDIVLGGSDLIDWSVFPPVGLESRVVMWQGGHIYDLNQQLDSSGAGWKIVGATDMNADGWILAGANLGAVQHAVLLLPITEALAVGDVSPAGVSLASPWPNPARGDVRLSFTLATAGDARLSIFDAQGRLVTELAGGAHMAGRHEGVWSGRDAHGTPVGAGLYFAALQTAAGRSTARIVRVR